MEADSIDALAEFLGDPQIKSLKEDLQIVRRYPEVYKHLEMATMFAYQRLVVSAREELERAKNQQLESGEIMPEELSKSIKRITRAVVHMGVSRIYGK